MEKTLSFTVEDALLSPIGFAILSGAGLIKDKAANKKEVHVHMTTRTIVDKTGTEIDLTDVLKTEEKICATAPIFVMVTESDGSLTGTLLKVKVDATGKKLLPADGAAFDFSGLDDPDKASISVMIDYYILRTTADIHELQIDGENFGGYYYVEADTLFRRQDTGVDMPANLTFPSVKIQSNFTFSMASSGDPSTFTFTMDAFPGGLKFSQAA